MKFEIISEISQIETIAVGRSIRVLPLLNKRYGKGRWRKKKALQLLNLRMAVSALRKFIGMKRTVSAKEI